MGDSVVDAPPLPLPPGVADPSAAPVQPQRDVLLDGMPSRAASAGTLAPLTERLMNKLFAFLMPADLVAASGVSWLFYATQDQEHLWKALVLLLLIDDDEKRGLFCFHGSWRTTMLHPGRFPGRTWKEQVKPAPPGGFLRDSASRPRWARFKPRDQQVWYDTRHEDLSKWPVNLTVDRRPKMSREEFIEQYEKPNKPVVITGAFDHWRARAKWRADEICKHYGEVPVRTNGRSTNGRRFRMRLFDFLSYAHSSNREKYLYVFDKKIFDTEAGIEEDYEIPDYFNEDLFELMDEDDRPDYRWVLIGPHGSGSPLHTDPHRTSAWNAVIEGCKRVTFYPPHVIPPGVDEELIDSDYYASDDTLDWYRNTFPDLEADELPQEALVYPGDMIFIPSGWWHSVLNIGLTIAVTQNVCSPVTFPMVAADINAKAGKHLRRDFKCALAESEQWKHLSDEIQTKKASRAKSAS